jgi:beta-galactosidase
LGLLAIVRPGPYICAEWDFGGFPAWLLSYRDVEIRCYNDRYVEKLRPFLVKTLEKIRPHLIENGGNVIMLQVENEYGSYGNDKKYLNTLYGIYRECGMNGILFTSDGASRLMLGAGKIDGCLSFANFGSRAEEQMGVLEKFVGDSQPLGCMEFWGGWFDYWHEEHHERRSTEEICAELEWMLKNECTFNYYMFHGGTNFGFTSGATDMRGEYKTVVTSYDDLAVLTEAGDRTPLYYAVRDLMGKYGVALLPITATETKKAAYGEVAFTEYSLLFDELDVIGKTYEGVRPKYMEEMGQASGYVLYLADLAEYHLGEFEVRLYDCCDRAVVFLDGEKKGVYERSVKENLPIYVKEGECKDKKLAVLLENTGRTGYGENFCKRKGIADICVWGQRVFGWKSISLPMDDLSGLTFRALGEKLPKTPAFFRAKFTVEEANDTFLRLDGFGKGFAVVNGFNLGRYYTAAGPQKTLFVPACVLKQGENELIVFDADGAKNAVAKFVDIPEL